jgi:(R,R)-butanediol dehydrogenase / meso-butanediol dehydrogenase / diacetyl reductase
VRAAVFRGAGAIRAETVPAPICGAGDIVVAVGACGICGSDLHAFEHGLYVQPGQVMGHEFAGEVVQVGTAVDGVVVGDRVAVMPYVSCGQCRSCDVSRPHLCPAVTRASIAYGLPGGFAELVRVPDVLLGRNVHRVSDSTSYEAAALSEPLAVALHAVTLADPRPGDRAMVVGQGPIGLLVVQALRLRGLTDVIAIDVAESRLNVSREVGATTVVLADGRKLSELGGGEDARADVVFECSGQASLVDEALRALTPGGTVIALAVYSRRVEINPSLVVQRELALLGAFAATAADFATAVGLIDAGHLWHEPLISHRFTLAEVDRAFAAQAARDSAIKVMIRS